MIILRYDLRNAHEEADVIVIHQMLSVVKSSTNDMYLTRGTYNIFRGIRHLYHVSLKRFERSNGLDTALYKNYFCLRVDHVLT